MNSDPNWAGAAQKMQETLASSLQQVTQAMASFSGTPGKAKAPEPLQFDKVALEKIQQTYLADAAALWNQSVQAGNAIPIASDKRFANTAWNESPVAKFSAAAYLLNARTLMGLAEAVEGTPKTKARMRFAVEQWMAATAPSNYLTLNAEAQKRAVQTQGESIAKGLKNLLHDIQQGYVSMTDESVFEVGKNVATTEGAVVFENEFFQLLEYKPLTEKVFEKPFLLVPPCINKFYILDLQPENSLIRYAVAQGHHTFVVSWRNPDASMAKKTWDDYIEHAAIQAIH
ncbi:MAG: class I poly(R)-hydroxyalkanoic acid synthase, partial [Polaromonas sp.]|nr:class I poly(R)-hydroxyalkanoic acid synthase [Polaromonas sp.]